MNYDNELSGAEDEGVRGLGELISESEHRAIETLIEGTIEAPSACRGDSIDTVFSAIAHPGRRYVLTYLLRAEGYVTMSELVDYVMDRTDEKRQDENLRRDVTITLTHTHLPSLDEKGFVDYNVERQLIVPTEKTPLTAPYLKLASTHQRRFTEELEP
ncbi:MAG: DUF7344 domain-containing protein [Halobacteriota archaeon]